MVVNDVPPMDRDIAMVFQNYALYPHMSVAGNMAFGLKMRKFEKAEIEKRIKQRRRHPRHRATCCSASRASSRAASASAWRSAAPSCATPRCSCSTSRSRNLDAKLRVQMRVELKKLHERLATTSIYVTHDQVEAMTLGDRVVVMKDGVVQQVGEPLELYNTPANRFVAGFIGSPAMNFADVTLAAVDGKLWAEAPGLRIGLPDALARAPTAPMPAAGHARHPAGGHPYRERRRPCRACFDAEVEVVEQLGSEILLDTRVGNATYRRLGRADAAHEGARQAQACDQSRRGCTCSTPQTEAAI